MIGINHFNYLKKIVLRRMISLTSIILCYNNVHLQHIISTSMSIRDDYHNTMIPNFNGNNGMGCKFNIK